MRAQRARPTTTVRQTSMEPPYIGWNGAAAVETTSAQDWRTTALARRTPRSEGSMRSHHRAVRHTMMVAAPTNCPQKWGQHHHSEGGGRSLVEALFRTVKRLCYAGLDSVTLRREVAARLVPRLGFDAHAFSTCDPDTGLMTHTLAEGVPPDLARLYLEELYPRHCACLTMDLPRVGVAVYTGAHDTPAMQSEIESAGIHSQLHASFTSGGRLWGTWCLMRERNAGSTDAHGRALLERLVPHLARGLQSAALIDHATAPGAPDRDGAGVLVLDPHQRPILRTVAAGVWLDDLADDGLRMESGLPMSVHALASRLQNMPVEVAASLRARARGASGRWYSLRATVAEPDVYGVSATVVVVQPAAVREIAALLTQLYD